MSGPKTSSPKKYSSRHTASAGLVSTLTFALTGCGRSPSFNVLGSYFPGWIACMVASILVTALVRFALNRLQWEQQVPALPLFYFSIALLVACLIWLIAFE
jgi:heme O synthase-like polyprenyltransferase